MFFLRHGVYHATGSPKLLNQQRNINHLCLLHHYSYSTFNIGPSCTCISWICVNIFNTTDVCVYIFLICTVFYSIFIILFSFLATTLINSFSYWIFAVSSNTWEVQSRWWWCVLKGVQLLVPSPGLHDASFTGITSLRDFGDDMPSKPGESALMGSRSSKVAGPGIGKPAFDSDCGKKGNASRQRVWLKTGILVVF